MKKLLVFIALMLTVSYLSIAQCDPVFPMPNAGAGIVLCKPDFNYLIKFWGHTVDSIVDLTVATSKSKQERLMKDRQIDCKSATSDLLTTKSRLINFAYNADTSDYDFYIAEFVDSTTNKMLAIHFGSINCDNHISLPGKIAYLLPISSVDTFINTHKTNNLTEILKYNHTNGSYLYEIYDTNILCGIRYYSITNNYEYKIFFK